MRPRTVVCCATVFGFFVALGGGGTAAHHATAGKTAITAAAHHAGAAPAASSVVASCTAAARMSTANPVVALGKQLAAAGGWTGGQWTCLNALWTRESSWQETAINPQSGAYGVAQALGHLDAEADGLTAALVALNRQGDNYPAAYAAGNPPPWGNSDAATQIRWGLSNIKSTYGTPADAEQHEITFGWY